MSGDCDDLGRAAHVQRVASYYDDWTAAYLTDFGHTLQAHRPTSETDLHEYLFKAIRFPKGGRALDAGCGVCGPAAHFALHGQLEVEALTVSPQQAELARGYVASQGASDEIHVRVGDYHQLASLYPAAYFDVVYFLESISHATALGSVIDGAFEVLKPGGVIYVKDFFARPAPVPMLKEKIATVIAKVDQLFAVKTPRAEELFRALWARGFLPEFVRAPQFRVDNGVWQRFDARHGFDLFDGAEPFDWSQWLEFRFIKPG
jgi:ubiquinone/menaquinone biosynthesis C-methylase UbiE